MAAITLTEQNWEHIMVPILKAGLPRSGIDRSFPRDTLHGPTSLQGMGFLHPWHHQEITHLLVCLQQTPIRGTTGQRIAASTEQLRLELGLPGWLTDHDYEVFGALTTASWITTVWRFTSRFKIELRDSEAKLEERRTNDQFLMLAFAKAGFRGPELNKLNICRNFLHSVTLSDISTVNGQSMSLAAWLGTAHATQAAAQSTRGPGCK